MELGNYYWHREEMYLLALMDTETVEWQQLGYAWYLSLCVDPYCDLLQEESEISPEEPNYQAYVSVKGDARYASPEDWKILQDSISYACLTKGMCWGTFYMTWPLRQTGFFDGGDPLDRGNQMSVVMASSFISYLSEHYGFDRVSAFCFGQTDFEGAFGTDLDTACDAWEAWILETYGQS